MAVNSLIDKRVIALRADLGLNDLFPFSSLAFRPQNGSDSILGAQITSILNKLPLVLFADLLIGGYLFVVLQILLNSWLPLLWYCTLVIGVLLGGSVLYLTRRNPSLLKSFQNRFRYVLSGSIVSGLIWGSVWFYLPPQASNVEYGLVTLWQCCILTGAVALLSINLRVFLAFVSAPIVITSLFLSLHPNVVESNLALAFVSYVLFIIPLSLYIGSDLNRGVKLEDENLKLQKILQSERELLQAHEKELRAQKTRELQLISEVSLSDRKLQAAAEERLLLLEAIEVGILGVNNLGKVTFANASALRLMEYDEDDIIGERVSHLVRRRGGDADVYIETTTALTSCYEQGISSNDRQSEFVTKSGKSLPVQFSSRPIYSKGTIIGAVISFSDISKQKEMESILVQTQKLEALGRITGGVAHDFNNLLTVMIGNLQFLRKQAGLTDTMQDLIGKVMNAATSGSDLVSRLLGFAKAQQLRLETHDLKSLLSDIEGFLTRILSENIEVVINSEEADCIIVTDKTQFQNAIFNLCVNARDAMPEGGKLIITPRLMSDRWSLPTSKPGTRFVELTIEDNGIGMEQDVKSHIFDPFFTTKDVDKGSGLGLSTVYGFMKQSGGNITVQSEPGKGTTFRLYIPISLESRRAVELIAPTQSETRFQGTVLVVEDDDEVRSVAAQILVGAGYEVITAKDGQSGLEQFEKHPEIDLVFSDVIMPGGMSGIDLAEHIHKIRPAAPILLVTGYTDPHIYSRIPVRKNIACLSKPFDADQLPRFISSLITGVAS